MYSKVSETELRKVIKLCPYNADAYLALGRNLRQQGNLRQAQAILQELLDLKPNSSQGRFELAQIYETLKDYKKVIRQLNAGLAIEATLSIELQMTLAEAYVLSGNTNEAIRVLYEAIEIFPEEETARAHAYLGSLLGTKGQYKKALDESRLALKIDPDTAKQKGFRKYLKHLEGKVKP